MVHGREVRFPLRSLAEFPFGGVTSTAGGGTRFWFGREHEDGDFLTQGRGGSLGVIEGVICARARGAITLFARWGSSYEKGYVYRWWRYPFLSTGWEHEDRLF